MSNPKVCPTCDGKKTIAPGGNEAKRRVCGKCNGKGYLADGFRPKTHRYMGPGRHDPVGPIQPVRECHRPNKTIKSQHKRYGVKLSNYDKFLYQRTGVPEPPTD